MVQSRKNKDRDRAEKSIWILVVGAAVTSLVIDRKSFDPFNTIKLISILIVSSWLAGHLINSYRKNPFSKNSSGALDLLIGSLFVLFLATSSYFSENRVLALTGDVFRRNGFLQYLALTIIFLFASRSIDFKHATKIYKVSILTALIMSSYGLIQISGNDFFDWNNPYNSMISTVGNPNFASALLAVFFLMCFSSLFITQISINFKRVAFLTLSMATIAIILSDSRQGLVTIAIGVLTYACLYFYFNRRKVGIAVISISLCIAVAGVFGMLKQGPLSGLLYKDSVSARGYYWRAGIEMFLDKPFTGVGIDNYGAHFKEFRELAYPLKYGFDITSSNAHNTIIQLFATGGLFVGLSYLLLIIYILFTGLVLVKNTTADQQKIALGLLSAWLGFQAQTIISIDNIGVSVWGWVLGGSLVGLARKFKVDSEGIKREENSQNPNSIAVFQPLISSVFLISAVAVSGYMLQAERHLFLATSYTNAAVPENRSTVEFISKEVIDNPLAITYYKLQAANNIYTMGNKELGLRIIKDLNYNDPQNLDILRTLLFIETYNQNKESLVQIRTRIAQQDPLNSENYFELCVLYKELGKVDQAIDVRNKILTFAPNSVAAKKATELLGLP